MKGAIVHMRRNGMPHRVGDHSEDLCVLSELIDAIERAELPGIYLTGRGALDVSRRGVGVNRAEARRKHRVGNPDSPIASVTSGIFGLSRLAASTRPISVGLRAVVTSL